MDSTPSNGSSLRSRTRKANTSPAQPPNGASGKTGTAVKRGVASRSPAQATAIVPAPRAGLPPLETYPAIAIEDVEPELDGGQWPIKRVVGDTVQVAADIFKEGHDLLHARVQYRALEDPYWHEAPLRPTINDRWVGSFTVDRNTHYVDRK